MAATYGAYQGTGHLKVGIEVILETPTSVRVYYRVGFDGYDQDDNQTLTLTGGITGSQVFHNGMTGSHNHQGPLVNTIPVTNRVTNVDPGGTYVFAASLSGVFTGETPSHSVTYKVPVIKPTAPTGLAISGITSSQMTLSWVQPSNWGGNDTDDYVLQYATNSAFTGATSISVLNATSKTVTGLDSAQLYYWRVAAVNSAGTGPNSTAVSGTTLAGTSSAPQSVAVSNIGPTTARVSWAHPADDGGSPVTSYEVQRSRNASFSSPTTYSGVVGSPFTMTGMTPNSQNYVRVRAVSAAGAGAWSAGVPFMTLAGAKVMVAGSFADVPTSVMVAGSFVPVAPQKMVGGVWVY